MESLKLIYCSAKITSENIDICHGKPENETEMTSAHFHSDDSSVGPDSSILRNSWEIVVKHLKFNCTVCWKVQSLMSSHSMSNLIRAFTGKRWLSRMKDAPISWSFWEILAAGYIKSAWVEKSSNFTPM